MIRDLLDYLIRVKNGESEIDHLWTIHIVKIMAHFNLWFDTEDWAKARWTTKLLNYIIILMLFSLWPLIIIRICMDFDELPIHRVTEGISLSFGGFMTLLSCIRSAIQRDTLSQVVRKLDERYLAVPKDSPRLQKWWEEERKNYVLEGYAVLISLGVGCSVGTLQILIMLSTGGLFYATAIPLSEESYSWQWWIQMLYQSWNPIYSAIYYSLKEMLWLGIYYHLSVLYKVQADTIMEVCEEDDYNPDEEYKKLRGALEEIGILQEVSQKMNDFTSPYVFGLCVLVFAMLSISAITVLIQSVDGWFSAIANSIAFPVYVLLICGTWAFVGEIFSDSVDSVDQALYNCNWTIAPLRVKRLLLLYKIRMITPTFISGGPFFVMNLETFSEILKKAYYVLTILTDVLL